MNPGSGAPLILILLEQGKSAWPTFLYIEVPMRTGPMCKNIGAFALHSVSQVWDRLDHVLAFGPTSVVPVNPSTIASLIAKTEALSLRHAALRWSLLARARKRLAASKPDVYIDYFPAMIIFYFAAGNLARCRARSGGRFSTCASAKSVPADVLQQRSGYVEGRCDITCHIAIDNRFHQEVGKRGRIPMDNGGAG